jgi:hypothetical protein
MLTFQAEKRRVLGVCVCGGGFKAPSKICSLDDAARDLL